MTDAPVGKMPEWQRNLLIGASVLVATLAAGFTTGATVAAVEDGLEPASLVLPAAGLLVVAISGWIGWKLFAQRASEPVAPQVRTSQRMLIIGGVMGGALGLLLAVSTDLQGSGSLFGNQSIPATVAAIAILAWIVIGSFLSYRWLATIDEHERHANYVGALAGLYAYLLIEPSWWLGWRGGFLPAQQPMVTFLLVITIYTLVWFWRRSR